MRPKSLTSREFWQRQVPSFEPFFVTDNPFASLFERFLPDDPNLKCVEVGAYPGGFLCYLSKRFGYHATAIEYREDAVDIAKLFKYNNLPEPQIINADFFEIDGPQFDIVSSFGFAEHFADLQKVVDHHVKLIKPGGYLVLTMPRVRGYQWLVRRLVYTRTALVELEATHNLAAMRLEAVRKALKKAGLIVEHSGYAMNARLWVRSDLPQVKASAKWLVKILEIFDRLVGNWLPNSALYSPMIFTVSRKPQRAFLE